MQHMLPAIIAFFLTKQKLYEGGLLLPYLGQLPSNFIDIFPFGVNLWGKLLITTSEYSTMRVYVLCAENQDFSFSMSL